MRYQLARVRAMTDYRGRKVERQRLLCRLRLLAGLMYLKPVNESLPVKRKLPRNWLSYDFTEKRMEEHRTSSRISLDDFLNRCKMLKSES